jgi:prophage regulatory protein
MSPTPQIPPRESLLRIRDVLQRLPISRTSLYDGIKLGLYPAPVQVGKRTVAWRESEINELINNFRRGKGV